jgi:hypothetical protein
VPDSRQSADTEAKGLHITQAGPNLIRQYAYLDAETARQWDPQLAALYYDQMVHKGKHHRQALCAVATHLLDRVLIVLREDRAYELRDVDGTPVTGRRPVRSSGSATPSRMRCAGPATNAPARSARKRSPNANKKGKPRPLAEWRF